MGIPSKIAVDVSISGKKITLTADEGDLAVITQEFFVESPRAAIRFADILSEAPEMYDLRQTIVRESNGIPEDVTNAAKAILLRIDNVQDFD